MKILYTSDIHTHPAHLSTLLQSAVEESADVMILGGDLIPHHLPGEKRLGVLETQRRYLQEILLPGIKTLKSRHPITIYLDLGNDDLYAGRSILERADGDLFHLLHLRRHPFADGVDIVGYMTVPPTPFGRKDWEKPDTVVAPYAKGNRIRQDGYKTATGKMEKTLLDLGSEDTIEKDLEAVGRWIERPFILVAHSPPYETPLDLLSSGLHVGSLGIRRFIEQWAEKGFLIASLHGHIHESPFRSRSIATRLGGAVCINLGQHGETLRYALLELRQGPHAPQITIRKTSF